MTAISASPISSAARTTSPTPPRRSRSSALGYAAPVFGHFSWLLDAEGAGLSKRIGSLSLADLREEGYEPMALNALLARLGSAGPVEPRQAVADLVDGFDLGRFSRAPARPDPTDARKLAESGKSV